MTDQAGATDETAGWSAGQTLGGFARACRAAGLPVTADRERSFLQACAAVGLSDRDSVYWAGRATLTAAQADVEPFDRVFSSWFGGRAMHGVANPPSPPPTVRQASLEEPGQGGGGEGSDEEVVTATASATEVLRHRDVAGLSPADQDALRRQFATLTPRPPTRPARRHTPSHRGSIDGRATVRAQLRALGEPGRVRRRRRVVRARRVVLLVDVSGSMSAYDDNLLRLAHRMVQAAPRTTEVFTLGTRLTHVTRALRERQADRARRCRTGPAARGWARRWVSSCAGGVVVGWRAVRSSWSSATGGSGRVRSSSGRRCASCGPWRTAWCG